MGATNSAVNGPDQGDGQPTLNIAVPSQVGLIPFRREAAVYVFKRSLLLQYEKAIY